MFAQGTAVSLGRAALPRTDIGLLAVLSLVAYGGLFWLNQVTARGTPALPPWNPGIAIVFALVLLRGIAWLTFLLIGALAITSAIGHSLAAAGWPLVEIAVYGAAAGLLRGRLPIGTDLQGFEDVFRFIAVVSLAAGAMAVAYALSVRIGGMPLYSVQIPLMRHWLGDMIGLAVMVPPLLVYRGLPTTLWRVKAIFTWECLAQAGAILGTLYLMFPRVVGSRFYPMFIPLVWVAARHGLAGVAAVLPPIQLAFVTAMLLLDLQASQEVKLQILMLSLALTGLLLGAMTSERERARAAAIDSEARLKAMRGDLDRRRFEIEHASRSSLTGELAAALAHELNQPLTAIVNYVGASQRLLSGSDAHELAVDQLVKASAQAERAGQVIRRLREFFCNAQIAAEPVTVADMVNDVLLLMEDEAIRAGTRFELLVPQDLVAYVDKLQIEQVLINLARNSLDALAGIKPGPRVIHITARLVEDGMIRLSLEDTGPGIAKEVSDRLFAPFTTTRSFGMGLGLSISRSIVQAHGGQLWLDEAPERGALMHFTIPIYRLSEES